jgi:transposase
MYTQFTLFMGDRGVCKRIGCVYRNVWVTTFKGKTVHNQKKPKNQKSIPEELPSDVKRLQEELRKVKLQNELLNAIIDIAEDQLKINIRKKSGTKR